MHGPHKIGTTKGAIAVLAVMPAPEDQRALRRILPRPEWSLFKAFDVQSAVAQLARHKRLSLVLCERSLLDGTWKEMLQHLLNMNDPPYLIVTSLLADERLWAEALNLGAYDVLAKPFEEEEVYRTLRSAWMRWRDRHRGMRHGTGPSYSAGTR